MNEEEKKAIEIVKKIKNMKFKVTSSFYSSGTVSLNIEEKEAIDTVLNLITKLQKENEEVKRAINVVEKEKKQWIEEDICSKIENEHCDKMNFGIVLYIKFS